MKALLGLIAISGEEEQRIEETPYVAVCEASRSNGIPSRRSRLSPVHPEDIEYSFQIFSSPVRIWRPSPELVFDRISWGRIRNDNHRGA